MKTRLLHALLLASGILIYSSLLAEDDYSYLALPEPEPQNTSSGSGNPFKNFDIELLPRFHRRNLPVKPEEMLLTRSCEELDYAITYLLPDTYNYKPGFYDDNYHGAAVWGSTVAEFTIFENSWLYLPYSWLIGYLEQGQQHKAFYHVEQMRRAKAVKNCYVN
ncbi:MAG: hypothetical protein HKP55_05915 [Gammaproteobacteria bacterium]|nr:hypothetical protein [Gammaproteobacteria bacterium]